MNLNGLFNKDRKFYIKRFKPLNYILYRTGSLDYPKTNHIYSLKYNNNYNDFILYDYYYDTFVRFSINFKTGYVYQQNKVIGIAKIVYINKTL